jgi:Allene oxide cyclase
MSKRLLSLAAAVALLTLVVGIIGPVAATKGDKTLTFAVVDKNSDDAQNVTLIDVGAAGFSIGDYFVLSADPVFNRQGTREVGVTTGDCLIVHTNAETVVTTLECDATFTFSQRGSLTVEGPVSVAQSGEESGRVAITGGTNQFKTAHGEVVLTPIEGGLLFTFHVIL